MVKRCELGFGAGPALARDCSTPHAVSNRARAGSVAQRALHSRPRPWSELFRGARYGGSREVLSAGFDAANNDWYWLKRGADGKVQAEGNVAGCIGWHQPAKRDYVLTSVAMK